ncbi:hypothetical protein [Rhodopirellula halodulae]|uniref:hypothetical protein n=1 Tax=Rhodopirellula halodulae TaxID=2894198 RepID=UPI001E5CF49D|nr:hypothetical protein [Rhodopirellula sp. JC737]MCC9655601.1 hypothetical protein [Rhodopirellula sp. JC737]
MGKARERLQRIGDVIDDYGLAYAALISGLMFGAFGVFTSDEFRSLFPEKYQGPVKAVAFAGAGISLVCAVVFGWKQIGQQDRFSEFERSVEKEREESEATVRELKEQIAELADENRLIAENVQNLVEGYLFRFATGLLGFGTRDVNSERVTLYFHDPAGNFIPIGRYSENQAYRQLGKSKHSNCKGCIGRAWNDDWCFDDNFADPERAWKGYVRQHERYGFDETAVEGFSMRSRLYCGCRIKDTDENEPIAVIVIESTEPDRFTEDELKAALLRGEMRFLSDLVEGLRDSVMNPSRVAELGY